MRNETLLGECWINNHTTISLYRTGRNSMVDYYRVKYLDTLTMDWVTSEEYAFNGYSDSEVFAIILERENLGHLGIELGYRWYN